MVDRSKVRPAVCGGCAVIPPGLIGPTGTAVPGVPTGAVVAGAVNPPGAAGLCPASEPVGLTVPLPATPALRAPAAVLLPPAGAPPVATWADTAIGRIIEIAKLRKITFIEENSYRKAPGQLR